MREYNINAVEQFNNDYKGTADYDCALQMFALCEGIIKSLEKYYDGEFTEEEIEAGEGYIGDYFNDCLDIEYTIGSDMSYRGCEVCLAWGGPGIWLNTNDNVLKCRWWGMNFNIWLPAELSEMVDSYFSEVYEMTRI